MYKLNQVQFPNNAIVTYAVIVWEYKSRINRGRVGM